MLYADTLTVKEALDIFYEKNMLGPDGNIDADWIKVKLGPFYIPFPNTPARKEAVRFHDIHHIITGYPTTWRGEAEVGAWEISSGCGKYRAAWIFDMGIFALGLFIFPKAVFNGFIRGRRSRSFYNSYHTYQQILQMTIAEAQASLNLNNASSTPVTGKEIFEFAMWWLIAFVTAFAIFVAPVAFVIHLIVDR